jgi:hypothetical protein
MHMISCMGSVRKSGTASGWLGKFLSSGDLSVQFICA